MEGRPCWCEVEVGEAMAMGMSGGSLATRGWCSDSSGDSEQPPIQAGEVQAKATVRSGQDCALRYRPPAEAKEPGRNFVMLGRRGRVHLEIGE